MQESIKITLNEKISALKGYEDKLTNLRRSL